LTVYLTYMVMACSNALFVESGTGDD